jgi:hypothetical protein
MLPARVSLPYAVALCDGQVGLSQFNASRVQAEDVQALMQRVELHADAALNARPRGKNSRANFASVPAMCSQPSRHCWPCVTCISLTHSRIYAVCWMRSAWLRVLPKGVYSPSGLHPHPGPGATASAQGRLMKGGPAPVEGEGSRTERG